MATKDGPKLFELLNKSYQQIYFEQYAELVEDSAVPEEIRCKECNGTGGHKLFGSWDDCVRCAGTGIPPIPNFEIHGPKRLSKAKK